MDIRMQRGSSSSGQSNIAYLVIRSQDTSLVGSIRCPHLISNIEAFVVGSRRRSIERYKPLLAQSWLAKQKFAPVSTNLSDSVGYEKGVHGTTPWVHWRRLEAFHDAAHASLFPST